MTSFVYFATFSWLLLCAILAFWRFQSRGARYVDVARMGRFFFGGLPLLQDHLVRPPEANHRMDSSALAESR